jgi:hypothetical protein
MVRRVGEPSGPEPDLALRAFGTRGSTDDLLRGPGASWLSAMERVNSAHGVVDVRPLGRPIAEVEPRPVEPAIDYLESEIGDRDWEFLFNGILVDLAAELPLDVVQSTGRTTYESRVFEATDDVRDSRLLQTQSKAEPMNARSVRRIGRERILQSERD